MSSQSHVQTRVNYYICLRLKADETGLTEIEELIPNKLFEQFYTTLNAESDKLSVERQFPLRFNWIKARKDYQDTVGGMIDELQIANTANWLSVVGLMAITKMFIRRYKEQNPLFAAMFSLEMYHNLNKIPNSSYSTWCEHIHKNEKRNVAYKKDWDVPTVIVLGLTVCTCYFWWRLLTA